jgi:hypothetical protein
MSTPRLWAKQTIDISREKPAFVDLALTHSRTQPLRIRINDFHRGIISEHTLHRLVAHSGRVQELEYFFDVDWLPEINQRLAGVRLVFPRLRRLSLVSDPCNLRYAHDVDDYGAADTRLYRVTFTENWSTPQLDNLNVDSITIRHIAGSDLRRFAFAFAVGSDANYTGRLSSLLAQNASLREFTLTLKGFGAAAYDGAFPLIELNHLSKFALLVHDCGLYSGTIRMLESTLKNISMPRFEESGFELNSVATENKFVSVTHTFLDNFSKSAIVKQLVFSLGRTSLRAYRLPLDICCLQPFPRLEHLTVETQCVSVCLDGIVMQMPPLRTLNFRRCYGAEFSEFEEIIEEIAHHVQNGVSRDRIVDTDGALHTSKIVVPLKIVMEECGHIDRSKLGAIWLPEDVSLVWRNTGT